MATNGDKWRQMATIGSRWKGLVAALGLMFVSNTVNAQVNPLPWENLTEPAAYVTFDVAESGWTLYPVITANDDFIGFFGYLPDEFVVGDNVSLLWMIPDNGDGSWSMYGWSNTDLKVVSDYLDNLTGTENVLADTGLDIFAWESQPIVDPKSMPFGIAEDDPFAPIMEATQDPAIADALIAVGAAGAPNLTQATNMQPVDSCPPAINNDDGHITLFDMQMASRARTIQEMMLVWVSDAILDSLAATGLDQDVDLIRYCWCFPGCATVWNGWTAWSCTNPNGFPNGAGGCRCTQCSRSRTGVRVCTGWDCLVTSTTTLNDSQGPMEIPGPVNPDGSCGGCP